MAIRGRKPKPLEMKTDADSAQKLEELDNAFTKYTEAPAPPPELPERARQAWADLAPRLVASGVFRPTDRDAFTILCDNLALYWQAFEELQRSGYLMSYTNKAGAENVVPSPWVGIQKQAFYVIQKLAPEFGLTPSSRGRLALVDETEKAGTLSWLLLKGPGAA